MTSDFKLPRRTAAVPWPLVMGLEVDRLQSEGAVRKGDKTVLEDMQEEAMRWLIVPDLNAPPSDELRKFVQLSKARFL